MPWYAKLLAVCAVAYAFSPIDLVPDFIPVLGYLDDLVLVPLGIALVLKMIPADVMAESREKAQIVMARGKPTNWGRCRLDHRRLGSPGSALRCACHTNHEELSDSVHFWTADQLRLWLRGGAVLLPLLNDFVSY